MPTVRRADRQVTTAPLRGGQMTAAATAESEGAGVQRAKIDKFGAVAQFGDRVTRFGTELFGHIIEKERAEADQTALLNANNQLSDWKNKRLYDATSGAFTVKGKDAMPLPEEIHGEFEKVASGIEAGLGSDRQRAAFANLRSQEWQGIDLQVRRHVMGEMQAYRAGELKSLVENSINSAIQSALDPKMVGVELEKAVTAVRTTAPALGLGPEAIEAQVKAVQTKTHVGVISSLLAQDKDKAAAVYFEAAKGQIAGEQQDAVIKALEEGSNRGTSQKLADEIIAKGGTLTEQREAAKEITDPKVRDLVEQRIVQNDAIKEREERETEQDNMLTGYNILDKNPDVTKIPPALWTRYSGGTRSAMKEYALKRIKGDPIETDLPTYYARIQEAGTNPEAFVNRNLLEDRAKLGETEFKQLAGLQLSIRNSDSKATEKELAPFQTREALLDATLEQYGIDSKAKSGTPEASAIAQLRRMVDRRVDLLQTGGKKASNQDIQAEIDALMSQTREGKSSIWNIFPGGNPYPRIQKPLLQMTIDDVPAIDKTQIEAALKARNKPVSPTAVLDLWLEMQVRAVKK